MALALGLTACGSEPAKPAAKPAAAKGAVPTAAPVEVAAVEAGEEADFTYSAVVDPFEAVEIVGATDDDGTCGVLCSFDLAQLRVKGIIWDIEKPRALIEDDQGNGYIVAVGDRIGNKKGNIIDIKENEVMVLEKYDTGVDFYVVQTPMKLNPTTDAENASGKR